MSRRIPSASFVKHHHNYQCPREIHCNVGLFADFTCQGALLCDATFSVLIPAHPCDVLPDVQQLVPLANIYMPWGKGTFAKYYASRYPEVAYVWTCGKSVHNDMTIDRFRPASAGGLYGWDNVGVLCPFCQRFKGQHWPWVDYRPTMYKRRIEAYLQQKYGRQLYLFEEDK